MKVVGKLILFLGLVIPFCANAGIAKGKVIDVTLRTQDNVILVRTSSYLDKAECANWGHPFGMKYDTDMAKAIYSMLLAAKSSGQVVKITGYGYCQDGKGYEVIKEVNFGEWGQ